MNLFHCADAAPETVPVPASVQTPLGRIRLDAVLDGVNVAAESPTESRAWADGGHVTTRRAALDTLQAEMQGYSDDRSEIHQEGEEGEAFQEILDRVEEARTAVEDLSLE